MLSQLMTRREQFLLLAVGSAICLGAVALYMHDQQQPREAAPPIQTESVQESRPPAEPLAAAPAALPGPVLLEALPEQDDRRIMVSVRGAVHEPGVYDFGADARVRDLLEAAGGALPEANLHDINLAAQLIDATTLTVPAARRVTIEQGKLVGRQSQLSSAQNRREYTLSGRQTASEVSAQTAGATHAAPRKRAGLLNLNLATAEQLEALPGIGPITAQRIIEYRARRPFQTVDDLTKVHGIGPKKLEAVRPLVSVE